MPCRRMSAKLEWSIFCSFLLFNDHFLNTTFDFDTSSDKTNGKLSNGNENHFDIAMFSR